MTLRFHSGLILAAALVLGGCASGIGDIPTGVEALGPRTGQQMAPAALTDYRVGMLDKLRVNVFREPDLSVDEVVVDAAGTINLPLVGEVPVLGRTVEEIGTELERRLDERYLRNSRVAVSVTEANSYTFAIEGEVNKPGNYQIPGKVTLLQAVAIAEGVSERAQLANVLVFRTIDGRRHAARFNLEDIRFGKAADPELQAGDTIVVNYSTGRQVYRDVLQLMPGLAGVFVALAR